MEPKPKRLWEDSPDRLATLKGLNETIRELLVKPHEKMPVIAQTSREFRFLPTQWTDFSIISRNSYGITTTIGEAKEINIKGGRFLIIENPDIPEDAEEVLQNPLMEWKPAKLEFDVSTRAGVVTADNEIYHVKDIPNKSGWEIASDINEQLSLEGAGMYVVGVYSFVRDGQADSAYQEDARIMRVRNDHISASVAGAAFFGGVYGHLMAIEMVAHKTSMESLLATFRQGKKVNFDGVQGMAGFMDKENSYVSSYLPQINMMDTFAVSRYAKPGGYRPKDEVACVISFETDKEKRKDDLESLFVDKMIEISPIPIRKEWAADLFIGAQRSGFIKYMDCFGSIRGGLAIFPERDWSNLISNLLSSGRIKI